MYDCSYVYMHEHGTLTVFTCSYDEVFFFSRYASFAILFRERRRLRKEKRKLKERLVKKGDVHKEMGEIVDQEGLFRLKDIRSKSQLEEVEKGKEEDGVLVGEEEESDSEGESIMSEGECQAAVSCLL